MLRVPVREIADHVDVPISHFEVAFLAGDAVGVGKVSDAEQSLTRGQHQLSADSHLILQWCGVFDQRTGTGKNGFVQLREIGIRGV